MIRFYYNLSPNPMKVALCLEELELAYEPVPVDPRRGEQFDPAYTALNPNAKVPTLVDGETVVFDSNAILLHLAETRGRFLPEAAARGEMLSWLMFVATGIGPFSGQGVHFRNFAPADAGAYARARYAYEARRHWSVLDARLAGRTYLVAETYTIVDMAVWGWARMVPFILGEGAFAELPNVKRHLDAVGARPAAQRAEALKGRHAFKAEMDAEARAHMFRWTAPAA